MTEPLRQAYRQLADEANVQIDLPTVRRRARIRRALPAATALVATVLAVTTGGAWLALRPPSEPPAPGTSATASSVVRVTTPASAPELPAGTAVGPAELIYSPCPTDCAPHVLLADGRQYRLRQEAVGPPTRGFTLSTDGRWLGRRTPGGYEVRDLTGTAVRRVDGDLDPWVWSPDSRWLLLAEHTDGNVRRYVRMDVQSGQSVGHVPQDAAQWRAVGVLPAGDLLLARGDVGSTKGGRPAHTTQLSTRTVDAATGTERGAKTIDLAGSVEPNEAVTGMLDLGPNAAVVNVFTASPTAEEYSVLNGLVHVDLATGAVLARRDLPERTGDGPWLWHGFDGIQARLSWAGSDGVEWVAVPLAGSSERVTHLLPPGSRVVGRGEGRY